MAKHWPYVLLAALAFIAPVAGSWYAARDWSRQAEFEQTQLMASTILRRADAMEAEADAATRRLLAARDKPPCSSRDLALMREIALGSSQLLAVGRAEGDRLLCSSLGVHAPPIPLGPPRYVSAVGLQLRPALELPIAPGRTRLVGVREGAAILLAPELIATMYPGQRDIVIGVATATGLPLGGRGVFEPRWRNRLVRGGTTSFIDGDRMVSLQHSRRSALVSYVAVPLAHAQARSDGLFATLLPLALLVGGISSAAVLWRAREQQSLPAVIRAALRDGEFFLAYQPIVELSTGRWIGAEALIRWRRSDGSMVVPDVFIPVAEDSGLITSLSRRVLDLLAMDAPAILSVRPDFRFSVNLSPRDLMDTLTIDHIRGVLGAGLAPANLAVEATERGVMERQAAGRVLQQVRALGVRLAIDDFGTGYANLAHLQDFEVDALKIDKSFVDTIGTGAVTAQVALLIIDMGRTLSLDLVAEGVEFPHQAEFLRDNGVQYAQGWLYAKAMTAGELRARLRDGIT